MTLRRLRWLLIPLLSAAVLVVLVLPPRALPERSGLVDALLGLGGRQWRENARDAHRWAVQRTREDLKQGVRARTHGAADLQASRTGRAIRAASEPLVLVRDGDVPDSAARRWLKVAEAEFAHIPRAGSGGVPVIVALHTRNPLSENGEWRSGEAGQFQFRYEAGTTRACIVDVVLPGGPSSARNRFTVPRWMEGNLLGRCALYGRFGFPGAEVGRWAGLGEGWTRGWRSWWYWEDSPFSETRAAPLEVGRSAWNSVPWAPLGCLHGVDLYCASLSGLASPYVVGAAGDPYYRSGWVRPDLVVAEAILHRGTDRFARFWTSALQPDSALHLAYGVPAGVLAREAFARRAIAEPTAEASVGELAVALGWVLALGALGAALALRREMDL